jgi:predicted nucleotidyltransferase
VPPSPVPTLVHLRAHRDEILRLAVPCGVSNIRVIGSVARGDAAPGDDIDLLVDFTPGPGGLALFRFAREVEELVGHPVDIGTVVRPPARQRAAAEAVGL